MTAARRGVEWKVSWRRSGWSPRTATASRRFRRRPDLDRFVDRLYAGEDGLAPVVDVHITWRHIGPWQPEDTS